MENREYTNYILDLNSIEPDIALSLWSFDTVADIWNHLKGIYSPVNQSRQFKLEYKIANINQEDKDIHSFYIEMLKLWTEQDMISSSQIFVAAYAEVKKERDRGRLM